MSEGQKWEIIAHEYTVSLFPLFILSDAMHQMDENALVGCSVDVSFIIENDQVAYFCNPENWKKAHMSIIKKIRKSPKFLYEVYELIEKLGKKQIVFTQKIKGMKLENLSNRDINCLYQKFVKSNFQIYKYGLVLSMLDFQNFTFFSDEIQRFLKEKSFEKFFSTLTTPTKRTYNKLQEINLLKIFALIKKNRALYRKLSHLSVQKFEELLKNQYNKIWKIVINHTRRYAWVHYVYEGPAATPAYFIEFLKDFVKREVEPNKELRKFKEEVRELRFKQKEILKKLHGGKYYHDMIKLGRLAVFYKPYRRELQSWSYYNLELLFKEIEQRLDLSLKQTKMMLAREVEDALLKHKLNIHIINMRLKSVVYGWEGNRNFCLVGNQAQRFLHSVKKEKVILHKKQLIGTIAQPGYARGRVKIVNSPKDLLKMNQGDILVSFATNPNLMPAIRKAAAIVTDEGGLTCHAAIVSREFKIPCIVGTRIATKIFKDGDRVEVDAVDGIIRKI